MLCTPFIHFSGLLTYFNDITNVMPRVGFLQWVNNKGIVCISDRRGIDAPSVSIVINFIKMLQVTAM